MKEPSDLTIRARLFRGYGPMVALLVSILTIALVVPSKVEVQTEGAAVDTSGAGFGDVVAETPIEATDPTGAVTDTLPTDPAAPGAAGTADSAAGGGTATVKGTTVQRGGTGSTPPAAAAANACSGRPKEVPGDDYSPPCRPWTPGSTPASAGVTGVTDKEIVVSVRMNAFVNALLDLLADAAGSTELKEPISKTEETLRALVEYFNTKYHFFGRDIRLALYNGVGTSKAELFGGGTPGAQADAKKVATEIKAFADISANTLPYAEQLRRQGVVNIGAPYPSKQWLAANAPYSWTAGADCTTIARTAVSYYLTRLAGKPATLAGGSLAGQPRKIAVIAPDNASYAQCADAAIQTAREAGRGDDIVANERYLLDFDRMAATAASLAPKVVASGATTVFCACDPVMLLFLTKKVNDQNVQPEWISTGVAYVDQDLVGQLMLPAQWKRAFGVSFTGPTEGIEGGEAWRAYKSVRPNGRPSIAVELIYYQLQMLAIGIMGAGPNLNAQTFAAGMFSYPATPGRAGLWAFGPDDFATADDAREIYWNPSATSAQNQRSGAWIETAPGKRYPIGKWPAGDPAVPVPGP